MRGIGRGTLLAFSGLIYRHVDTWQLGQASYTCRFSVTDPNAGYRSALTAAAQASRVGVPQADLRHVQLHPDDFTEETQPLPGAKIAWDGGELELLEWGQASDFTGTALGLAVVRR